MVLENKFEAIMNAVAQDNNELINNSLKEIENTLFLSDGNKLEQELVVDGVGLSLKDGKGLEQELVVDGVKLSLEDGEELAKESTDSWLAQNAPKTYMLLEKISAKMETGVKNVIDFIDSLANKAVEALKGVAKSFVKGVKSLINRARGRSGSYSLEKGNKEVSDLNLDQGNAWATPAQDARDKGMEGKGEGISIEEFSNRHNAVNKINNEIKARGGENKVPDERKMASRFVKKERFDKNLRKFENTQKFESQVAKLDSKRAAEAASRSIKGSKEI